MASKIKLFLSFAVLSFFLSFIAVPTADAGEKQTYTPESVAASIYKIQAYQNGDAQWSGTGWMLGPDTMISAGHVCDPEGEDGFTFRAISKWNQEYPLTVKRFSRDPDLCVLEAKHVPFGMVLNKLTFNPPYGATIWYSGAPIGLFGDGTVPFAKGYYIGGNKAMIAGYGGASGSPMYTENGVFGVLVAGWRGTHLIQFVPAIALYQFLHE